MPYIKKSDGRREKLRNGESAFTAGELNYQIFYFVKYNPKLEIYHSDRIKIFVNNFLGKNPNYQRYNDMTGCLIRCAKEIKRRLNRNVGKILIGIMASYDEEIDKYENTKIISNGDVE